MLAKFFAENPKLAVAFSGGVDSAYLLYAAKQYGAAVKAYYVKTPFQPQFEHEDALRLARQLDLPITTLEMNVLDDPKIAENPLDRCYICKKRIFTAILQQAETDGFSLVADGTNASDDASDRPGMRALAELGIRSPLQECGLTKEDIRRLSKTAGLFTHDKPSYACLATRIPTGTTITKEQLTVAEHSEAYLKSFGFSDFRVRFFGNAARIQLPEGQLELLLRHREEILKELKKYYSAVLLDLEVRP